MDDAVMNDVERISGVLRFANYFRTWPQEDILELASLCRWVRFDTDTMMISADEPASALYLIVNRNRRLKTL